MNTGSEVMMEFHDVERSLSRKRYFSGKKEAMVGTTSPRRSEVSSDFSAITDFDLGFVRN